MREGMRMGVARVVLVAFFSLTLFTCSGGGGGGGAPGGSTGGPDTTVPTVSSTSTANGATGVAVNTAFSVTFSEPMDASTINATTITVKAGSTVVPGTVSYSGTTATFTPTGNWAYSTSYTATITTGAKDLAGNALATNYVWNFSTGTETASVVTSLDKIGTAETAGVIDHDTALLYTLYVGFDPTSLPVEYRGDDSNVRISGTTIFFEVKQRLNSMPADLQARFSPFFLRPTNPLSIWQKYINDLTPALAVRTFAAILEGDPWKYVDCVTTPIRVWYLAYSFMPEYETNAKALAAEIDSSGMWYKERVSMLGHQPCTDALYPTGVNNGGDGKLDIYLTKLTEVRNDLGWPRGKDASGVTIPEFSGVDRGDLSGGCPVSTFNMIDPLLPNNKMKLAAAHELFHSFQFSILSYEDKLPTHLWWVEASATWAEDLVYPEDDSEQGYLKAGGWAFNDQPDGPLDSYEQDSRRPQKQYGAYIWPFYLSHRPGGKPEVIGELWEKSVSMTPLQAMEQKLDFPTAFKEFALWNWNKPPVQKYLDHGAPISTDNLSQSTKDVTNGQPVDTPQSPYTVDIKLDKVSVQYWHMREPASGVQKLRFDLSQISNIKGAGVQAIITIGQEGGQNYKQFVEDWSERTERKFCLAVEKVTDIVLVVSNSDITNTLEGKIKLEVLNEACTSWSGTFSSTYVFSTSGITRTEVWSGTLTLGHPVIDILGDITYSLDSASATVTWDEVGGFCNGHGEKTVIMGDTMFSGIPELIGSGFQDGPVFPPGSYATLFSDGSYSLKIEGITQVRVVYPCTGGGLFAPYSSFLIGGTYDENSVATKIMLINNRMQDNVTSNSSVGPATYDITVTWDFGDAP